jgi:sec-independent protein translocase protein TatC
MNPDDYRMSILDHLRELRGRLIVALWAVVLGFLACFAFADTLFAWLAQPMRDALAAHGNGTLAVTEAMEGLFVKMRVAGLSGFFLASPVVFWQAWQFVAPGMYDTERRHVLPLVSASTLLFLSGAAFAYFVVFRYGFPIFLEMNGEGIAAVLTISSYLTFATTLLVAFGASFQLPVVVYFLARLGLINARDMVRGFRYAIVMIFVVAAVLTPPDVLSQFLMAVPLLVLYVVGIGVAAVFSTKKADADAAAEPAGRG